MNHIICLKINNLPLISALKFNVFFNIIWLAILFATTVSAATITVTNTNDSGAGSLRQAITSAVSNDTIEFNLAGCPCTITLASELLIDRKSIIINGLGANQLTISGNNAVRVFRINSVQPAFVTISGVTISGGRTSNGAGIYSTNANVAISNSIFTGNNNNSNPFQGGAIDILDGSLHIIDSTFSNNSANRGGAIYTNSSVLTSQTITIINSTFSNNSARFFGGGIYISAPVSLTASNSNFTGNIITQTGGQGGGIYNAGKAKIQNGSINLNTIPANTGIGGGIYNTGTLELSKVTVSNNTSTDSSGGIHNTGTLSLEETTVSGNQTVNFGGGIYSTSVLTVSRSTISGNITNGGGGGIYSTGTLDLTNSTISGNQSTAPSSNGGGISSSSGALNITQSTIAFNSSGRFGGGILSSAAANLFNLQNTIIADNSASNNPDITANVTSNGSNLIENTLGASIVGSASRDIYGIDPQLNPLAANGGQTQTHSLQATSPAIDKASNSFGITTDQRGFPRFVDSVAANLPGGNNSDIGAYEYSATTAANVNVSGRVLTAQNQGIKNAKVILIDSSGNLRTVSTGSFGMYKFSEIEIGETYVLLVRSKNFRFTPQIITVNDELSEMNLTEESGNKSLRDRNK